ncbi:MAG: adenylate kinase family protein [Theionarchaea archaeon]|nr:adenylate kinase family protein [Theionarchaea archaeon]
MRIAITGTPGVGKTATAKDLSALLHMTHINVSEVADEMGAISGEDGNTSVVDTDILRQKMDDMDNIIVDSHFSELFRADFVFVLRCEPKILYERLKERGYPEKKIRENVEAEILDYCLISALEHHDAETVFEICGNAVDEIMTIVENPARERSAAFGSQTQFLTEENLNLLQ